MVNIHFYINPCLNVVLATVLLRRLLATKGVKWPPGTSRVL